MTKIDFINLNNVYKRKEDFSENEIKSFINENKDQLKDEYIDFKYIKITPKDLTGSDQFNELFFKEIDELENKISNGIDFNDLIGVELYSKRIKTKFIDNNPLVYWDNKTFKMSNLHIHSKRFEKFLPKGYKDYV